MRNVMPCDGATMQILDKAGMERTMGGLYKDDQVVVTAQDGVTTRTYFLSMLEDVGYLAYVVSDLYSVDQIGMSISGDISETTPVSEFLGHITPAPGATFKLQDKNGTEYSTMMKKESQLKVTSGNKQLTVLYAINVLTSRPDINNQDITLYPNPTSGRVNITGLEPGNRVHVYNLSGTQLRDIIVHESTHEISLEGQPSGMYFVVVSNSKKVIGRYKLVLK